MTDAHSRSLADAARRRALGSAACCGLLAALGVFHLPGMANVPAPPGWPDDVQALWQRAWQGVDPRWMADVHVHLLGHTAGAPAAEGAWINPRTLSPFAPGDWLRRLAIERAAGVSGHRAELSQRYLQQLQSHWACFPPGARPLLLGFDAVVDERGCVDAARTMFCTGDGYASAAAQARGWGWIASVHPHRADAIERLHAARAQGACAVKWLPSAMGIDPSAQKHRRFYRALADLDLPLLTHAGEEKAVTGANEHDWVNPLLLREPLGEGVKVIVAHCASLGVARDLDHPQRPLVPAFQLFARLMDDARLGARVHGDLSAITQINRNVEDLRLLLERTEWHDRLLYGSDYPLPALRWLTSVSRLADAGLLEARDVPALQRLQSLNPLAFDFALKRALQWQGRRFASLAFEPMRHVLSPVV